MKGRWRILLGKMSVRRGPRAGKIFCVGDTSFENYCIMYYLADKKIKVTIVMFMYE